MDKENVRGTQILTQKHTDTHTHTHNGILFSLDKKKESV